MKLTDNQYESLRDCFDGLSMGSVWRAIDSTNLEKKELSYLERKGYFLDYIFRLMKDGKLKFGSNGEFLEGSPEEQISMLNEIFPENQQNMEDGAVDGFWFLTHCQFGIVWINDDGYEDWT